jgi:hypothetical protein
MIKPVDALLDKYEARIRELEAEDIESAKEVDGYRARSESLLARIAALEAIIARNDTTESFKCSECGAWHVRKGGAEMSEHAWSMPLNRAELIARVEVLEAALRQARPYVDQAECADAADLEARYAVLSVIDKAFSAETKPVPGFCQECLMTGGHKLSCSKAETDAEYRTRVGPCGTGTATRETPVNAWLCKCGLTVKRGYACVGCHGTESDRGSK